MAKKKDQSEITPMNLAHLTTHLLARETKAPLVFSTHPFYIQKKKKVGRAELKIHSRRATNLRAEA